MPDPASISLAGPLDGFAPISLAEMDAVKLMNRVDTKYLTDRATLADVLRDAAAAGYRVLVADGSRISPYDSIYFDTIPMADLPDFRANDAACRYLAGHSDFEAGQLLPTLETLFLRITLVNPDLTERLTIDTNLCFKNFRTGLETSLGEAVVIELKQDGHAASAMKGILRDHRVKPARISKYCIAVTLTDPSARAGRFKEKVRSGSSKRPSSIKST